MIVLVSYNSPRTEGLFVNYFADSLSDAGVEVRFFSVRNAVLGRVDVVNLHWPELVTVGSNWPKRLGKWLAVSILLLRVRLQGIPVVHTVHNLKPHDGIRYRAAAVLQRWLLRSVDVRVYLNESAENDYAHGLVALHGKYPTPDDDPGAPPDGGVLFFGRLRRYKGIERLVSAYQASSPGSMPTLTIVGMGDEKSYEDELESLVTSVDDVELKLGFASDADLNRMILESGLVVLPYERMYNSGVALLALSARRPILVPDSPANQALQQEVGPGWVHIFPPDHSGAALGASIRAAHGARPPGSPNLSRRLWPDIAALYADLFHALTRERGGEPWERHLDRDAWIQHSSCNGTFLDSAHD